MPICIELRFSIVCANGDRKGPVFGGCASKENAKYFRCREMKMRGRIIENFGSMAFSGGLEKPGEFELKVA